MMTRLRLTLVLLMMIALVGCQGQSPTAPTALDRADHLGAGALHDEADDDDDDDVDDDDAEDDDDDNDTSPVEVPTATLTASPSSIAKGQSSTLSWKTSNATRVTLDRKVVNASGSRVVSPRRTTTYTLRAVNAAGSVMSTATVTVGASAPPPVMPTATLTASPSSIVSGQSSTLSWTTSNATSVTLNGAAVDPSGSQVVSPTATTTYTLRATNAAGTVMSTATVTVTASPPSVGVPTAALTASPSSIESGQSSTLSWTTSNATTVTLDGAAVSASGSQVVSPTTTTTYTLRATNTAGTGTSTATVTVTALPPPPPVMPTATLTASPSSIVSGQSATLSWTTSGATTVTLNGAPVAANGSQIVSPTATTVYTLAATNAAGTATDSAIVTVTAPVERITYVTHTQQIFQSDCVMCHSGPFPTAGVDLSSYTSIMNSGVVRPGDPNSKLIDVTQSGGKMHFYLTGDRTAKAETIRRWIVDFAAAEQ